MISLGYDTGPMSGVIYAIGAGIGFGIFQAVNRRVNREIDAYSATFLVLLVGTATLLTWALPTQDLELLSAAPVVSYASFAAAGIIHFFFGWTFLALSQQRIGAAATGAVVAATPLVGTVLAAVVLGEGLTLMVLVGVLVVVGGVATLTAQRGDGRVVRSVPWSGLAAAISWGSSPIFIRWGLEGLPAPLIGVTIGLIAATVAYALGLGVSRRRKFTKSIPPGTLRWVLFAGLLVAMSIAFQWIAFDLIAIAVAITLMQLAVPTVISVAPFLVGGAVESLDRNMLLGASAVVTGSVIVVLAGRV